MNFEIVVGTPCAHCAPFEKAYARGFLGKTKSRIRRLDSPVSYDLPLRFELLKRSLHHRRVRPQNQGVPDFHGYALSCHRQATENAVTVHSPAISPVPA